jgi:epoxyqueuosine reductase
MVGTGKALARRNEINQVKETSGSSRFWYWNKFASPSGEPDFAVRNGLDDVTLVELFGWSEAEFHEQLAGSAIHRIGYERWLRNLAVGLGNAPRSNTVMGALNARVDHPSGLVREHVTWALSRH